MAQIAINHNKINQITKTKPSKRLSNLNTFIRYTSFKFYKKKKGGNKKCQNQFWSKQILCCKKNLFTKRFWSKNNFWSKYVVQKNLGQKCLELKNFWGQKNVAKKMCSKKYWFKEMLGTRKFWLQKYLDLKKLCVQKNFVSKKIWRPK